MHRIGWQLVRKTIQIFCAIQSSVPSDCVRLYAGSTQIIRPDVVYHPETKISSSCLVFSIAPNSDRAANKAAAITQSTVLPLASVISVAASAANCEVVATTTLGIVVT